MGHRDSLRILTVCALLLAPVAVADEPADPEEPIDIGHVERVDSRLIQVPLVMTSRGAPHRSLDAELEVWVGDREMKGFQVELGRGRVVQFGQPAADPLVILPARDVRKDREPRQGPEVRGRGSAQDANSDSENNRDRLVKISYPPRYPGLTEIPESLPYVDDAYRGGQSFAPQNFRNTLMGVLSLNPSQMPRTPALRVVSPSKFLRIGAASYGYNGQPRSDNIQAALIPTGFDRGLHEALTQVSIPDPGDDPGSWLVTLSVRSGPVTTVVWGRLDSVGGEQRVVLQDTLDLPSGNYSMVAQAYHVKTGELRERLFEGKLEKPGKRHASFGPVAAFQKGGATVLKAGHEPNPEGAFAIMPGDALSPDRESALLVTLCGKIARDETWTVERSLAGPTVTEFPETEVESGEGRCVLLADRIPADRLEQGDYAYSIRVSDTEGQMVEQSSLWSVAPPSDVSTVSRR